MEAYEQCRSIFAGKASPFDKQGYVSGMAILIRKGFLAWLQYRNADTTGGVLQPIAAIYREPGGPADELALLLATLIGGNAYESEF